MIRVELHGTYIAFADKKTGFAVLDLRSGLPDPYEARAYLREAGIRGRSCTLILPRSMSLLELEKQAGTKRELLSSAELMAESLAGSWSEPSFSAYGVAHSGSGHSVIYAYAVPRSTADQYIQWLEAVGLTVRRLQLSCLAGCSQDVGGNCILLSLYPDEQWSIHMLSDGIIASTYSGAGEAELTKALSVMGLASMAKGSGVDDLPDVLEFDRDIFESALLVSGRQTPSLRNAVNAWQSNLESLGFRAAVTKEMVPSYTHHGIEWPRFALQGAGKPSKYRDIQKLDSSAKGRAISRFRLAGLIAVVLLTAALGVAKWWVTNEQTKSVNRMEELLEPTRQVTEYRNQLDQLTQANMLADAFFKREGDAVAALYKLEQTLPSDVFLQRFSFADDTIELVLIGESVPQALAHIEESSFFSEIHVVSAITPEFSSGERLERVTVRFRLTQEGDTP